MSSVLSLLSSKVRVFLAIKLYENKHLAATKMDTLTALCNSFPSITSTKELIIQMQHKKPTTYLREQKMNLGVRGESFLKFSFFKRRKPSDLCLRGSKSSNFPLDTVPPKAAA